MSDSGCRHPAAFQYRPAPNLRPCHRRPFGKQSIGYIRALNGCQKEAFATQNHRFKITCGLYVVVHATSESKRPVLTCKVSFFNSFPTMVPPAFTTANPSSSRHCKINLSPPSRLAPSPRFRAMSSFVPIAAHSRVSFWQMIYSPSCLTSMAMMSPR